MNKISECPNCKNKDLILFGDDLEHPECYLLFSANKEAKKFDPHSGLPLNAFYCPKCHFVSFFHAMSDEINSSEQSQK